MNNPDDTWGRVYHKWIAKGVDHGYAAWMADEAVREKERKEKKRKEAGDE